MIRMHVISHRSGNYSKIPPLLWIHWLNKTDFTFGADYRPHGALCRTAWSGVALMLVLFPLMSNTKTKAFTEAFCEQSSIPEAANSWTSSVGLSSCQCFFSQPEQSYTNLPTCPVQLWKYHLGIIVLLRITTTKWHKVFPICSIWMDECFKSKPLLWNEH